MSALPHPAFLAAEWSGRTTCGGCGLAYEARTFAPRTRLAAVRRLEELADAPPCAAHAGNAATATCQRCGTFACDLCRIDQEGMTLCASCYDRLTAEGALVTTRSRERNWGGIASLCIIISALGCIYVGWILGPVGTWAAWKGLRQHAANGDTKGRAGLIATAVLGLLLALASLAILAFVIVGIGSDLAKQGGGP